MKLASGCVSDKVVRYWTVRGSEFLRRIQDLGRRNGTEVKFVPHRGKGGHAVLFFGERRTIIRNLKDELKTGTMHAMLKQLGVDPKDFQVTGGKQDA